MIEWDGKVHLDHTFSFGATSAPGVFGRLADLLVHMLKFMSVDEIIKWVDDFVFFRFPKGISANGFEYLHNEQFFFDFADDLGWPWELSKHTKFAQLFTYLGFNWDIASRTVTLPAAKKAKYLEKIANWLDGERVAIKDVENVIGTLNHCTLVICRGRSRLVSIYRLSASFTNAKNTFVKYKLSDKVVRDIAWWQTELSKDVVSLKIIEPPPPETDEIYVDASTGWGIGFIYRGRWLAWKYIPGWFCEGRCIGWGEMVAIELALRTLVASGVRNAHFKLRSDNQGVIGALAAGKSYNAGEHHPTTHPTALQRTFHMVHHRVDPIRGESGGCTITRKIRAQIKTVP
jgi:hypothetical protein